METQYIFLPTPGRNTSRWLTSMGCLLLHQCGIFTVDIIMFCAPFAAGIGSSRLNDPALPLLLSAYSFDDSVSARL